jgi:uncharacterized RDD family membrane protein YckC
MSLPSTFAGVPASLGARLASFSIDAALVGVLAVAATLLWTPFLGVAVAAEALLGVWILQARTGTTPGAAVVGLRIARADVPYSPGAGRTFVRGMLLVLAALVLLAGAWVLVASAAWDRSGRRRSWADIASEPVGVAGPARGAAVAAPALATPTVLGRPSTGTRAPARPLDIAGPQGGDLPPAPVWGAVPPPPSALSSAPSSAPASATTDAPPAAPTAMPAPVAPAVSAPVAAPSVAPAAPLAPMAQGLLLLVFDTGQRAQFALPAAVNLGRSPAATEPGDALLVVEDPDRMVSKTHLRLEHDGATAWVTDAGSTNGSELVDEDGVGRPLAPGVRTPLDEDMRVRVGERTFTVSRLIGSPA